MEQAVARILRRSRHLSSSTTNLNLYENRFSYIKSMQMYTGRYPDIYSREYIGTSSVAPCSFYIRRVKKSNKR